ncbi:hypothetical protein SANTM175S_01287 [Streptomyces antimycoticus]
MVESGAVDEIADGGGVRGVDTGGGHRAPFDLVPQHAQALDVVEGPRLALRQLRSERGPHGGGLLLGGPLRPAVVGGRGEGGAGAERLLLDGEQNRLAVLGLYLVDQPGDLASVAHPLGDPVGVAGLPRLAVHTEAEEHADDRQGHDHQDVELPPERPAVQERTGDFGPATGPRTLWRVPGRLLFGWRVRRVHRHPGPPSMCS